MRTSLLFLVALVLAQQVPTPETAIGGKIGNGGGPAGLPTGIVTIGTLGYRDGRRAFMPNGSSQFDASGNYRVTPVRPGEYYIRAEGGALRGFPTYYPGTLDIDSATTIAVQAGQEIVGIDFDMKNNPVFRVSGTIANIPLRTGPNGQPDTSILGFTFSSADLRTPDPQAGPLVQTTRAANGQFEVSLPAGTWDLFPVIPLRTGFPAPAPTSVVSNPPMYATGRTRVVVKDRDVENVLVTVASADIKGRIIMSGPSATESSVPSTTRIGLLPKDNYPSPLISHVQPQGIGTQGEFVFSAVPPGRFALQILPMPPGVYLADIRVGAKSIYDDGVITTGADPVDPVEVVLSRGGGVIRVAISGTPDGPGPLRGIVLVPEPPRHGNGLLYKTLTFPDTPSNWVFSDVAPGRYKLFAIPNLPQGGAEQNSEFLAKHEDAGVTVNVAAGQTIDVQARWISSEKR